MIRKILMYTMLVISIVTTAQEATYSPYSLHGIGLTKFRGTVGNLSMGGLSIVSDPVTPNILNAATYADLKTTNFSVGGSYSTATLKSNEGESKGSATSFDYLTISIPANLFGFGFGLLPTTASGFRTEETNGDETTTLLGKGGVNRAYFGAGVQVYKGFKLGAEVRYNFGRIESEVTSIAINTRDSSQSDISGVSYAFSAIYDTTFKKKYTLRYSLNYEFSTDIRSKNNQIISLVATTPDGLVVPAAAPERGSVADRKFSLPSVVTAGIAFSQKNKWLVASEINFGEVNDFQDRFITRDNATYIDPFGIRFGGYFQPNYQSLNSYFERIIYRAGIRYDKTGLVFNNEEINEFGISFGLSLPLSQGYSTIDFGFEAGTRGTTNSEATEENFLNFSLGLSLTDKWFNKRKYD